MSDIIESGVVELQFNNANFEKNVKQSLTTIEKLKEGLNFDRVVASVNALENGLQLHSLKGISNSLKILTGEAESTASQMTKAFLGVADTITKPVMGAIDKMFNQIKTGGKSRATNIEKAKFQLQGLGYAWKDVGDSISNSVSGTAYGLDSAATAAANLMTSNIDLSKSKITEGTGKDVRTLSKLEVALKSVSGTAAQTGRDFDSIAYAFTSVASAGAVTGETLAQLQHYGVNTAAILGEAFGKTEAEIREMASKKQISADEFYDAMYKKFWKNAAKANDTVEGVTANIKAGFSKIGAAFYEPIIANEGPLDKFLVSFLGKLNEAKTKIQDYGKTEIIDGEEVLVEGKLVRYAVDLVTKYLEEMQKVIDNFNIIRLWRVIYNFLKGTLRLVDTLVKTVKTFAKIVKKDIDTFLGLITPLDLMLRLSKDFHKFAIAVQKFFKRSLKEGKPLYKLLETFADIFNGLILGIDGVRKSLKKAFQKTGIDVATKLIESFNKAVGSLSYILETVLSYIVDTSKRSTQLASIFESIGSIAEFVCDVFRALGIAIDNTLSDSNFDPLGYLATLLQVLTKGLTNSESDVYNMAQAFQVVTDIIAIVAKVIGKIILVFATIINALVRFGKLVFNVFSPIGALFTSIWKNINNFKKQISNIDLSKYESLHRLIELIKTAFDAVRDTIKKLFDMFSNTTSEVSKGINSFDLSGFVEDAIGMFDKLLGYIFDAYDAIAHFLAPVFDVLKSAVDKVKESINKLFGKETEKDVKNTGKSVESFGESFKKFDILGKLSSAFKGFIDFIKDLGKAIADTEVFKKFSGYFSDFMGDIKSGIDKLGGGGSDALSDGLGSIGNGISDFVKNVSEVANDDSVLQMIQTITDVIASLAVLDISKAAKNLTSGFENLSEGFSVNFKAGESKTFADNIKTFAEAILIIAGSLLILSLIKEDDLNKGVKALSAVAGVMAGLVIVMSLLQKNQSKLSGSLTKDAGLIFNGYGSTLDSMIAGIKKMAQALLLIAIALKIVDGMKWSDMADRLTVMMVAVALMAAGAVGLAEEANRLKAGSVEKIMVLESAINSFAKSLLKVAVAMLLVSLIPTNKLGDVEGALAIMVLALIAMLAGMVAVIKSFDSLTVNRMETFVIIGDVVRTFANSLLVVAIAMLVLSLIPEDKIVTCVGVMAFMVVALMAMMGMMAAMSKVTGGGADLAGMGLGILAIAGAMILLAVAFGMIALIPIQGLAKGILVMVGALVALAAVAFLITKTGGTVALFAIATVFAAIGVAALLVAAAVYIVVSALIKLAGAGPQVLAVLLLLGPQLAKIVSDLMSAVITSVINGIIYLIAAILIMGPSIMAQMAEMIVELIDNLLQTLADHLPNILENLGQIILDILGFLEENAFEWGRSAVAILVNLVEGLLTGIYDAISPLIDGIVQAVKDLLGIHSPSKVFLDIAGFCVKGFLNGLAGLGKAVLKIFGKLVKSIVDYFASGKALEDIKNVGHLIAEAFQGALKFGKKLTHAIGSAIKELPGYIAGKAVKLGKQGAKLIKFIVEGIGSIWNDHIKPKFTVFFKSLTDWFKHKKDEIKEIGKNIIDGIKKGIDDFLDNPLESITKLGKNVIKTIKGVLGIKSPSKEMAKVGRFIDLGLTKGIDQSADSPLGRMAQLASDISEAFDGSMDYAPSITPVVDMSNVETAAGSISGLFNNRGVTLSANIGGISSSMRRIQNADPNGSVIDAIGGLNAGDTNTNIYNVNGITYDDGSNVANAVGQLINAANIGRRI